MRDELNTMLGGRTDVSAAELNRWLNFAYIDLASSLELDELKASLSFNTVAAQAIYSLPNAVRAVRNLALQDNTNLVTGGHDLRKSTLQEFRKSITRNGTPREYFRENRLLVLYPTPDAASTLLLDFWLRPQNLVGDNDSPILPREWHEVIIKNARSKAHSALREFESAGVVENEFVSLVRRKEDPEAQEEDDRIVGSSVPRTRHALTRRHSRLREDDCDGLR